MFASPQELGDFAGGNFPEWGAGFANSEHNFVAMVANADQSVFLHELAHLAIEKKVGDSVFVPRWFHEGVARTVSSGLTTEDRARLAWAVLWRNVYAMEQLEIVNSFSGVQAELAYAQSHDAVLFLSSLCSVGTVLDSVAVYADFSTGFARACGMSMGEFYVIWQEHLARSYVLPLIIGDDRFLWSAAALLVILLGANAILRKKRYQKSEEQGIPRKKTIEIYDEDEENQVDA